MSSKELVDVAAKERSSGVVENDDLGSAAYTDVSNYATAADAEFILDLEILLWQGV